MRRLSPSYAMRPILLALLAFAASPALAQGQIAFDATRHDAGTVAEGDTAVHVFAFTNTGDTAVELASVEASCGCTVPSYTTEPVGPGERGEIAVAFDSGGRPGPFESVVHVTARGASPPDAMLRIVGTVTPRFAADGVTLGSLVFADAVWDAGRVARDGFVQHAFRFLNAGERPVRVLAVRAGDAVRAVAPSRPVFPGDIASVVVTVEPPHALAGPDGRIDLTVEVETDDPDGAVKTLRIVGQLASSSG